MESRLLIDAVVRQTTLLIAQLATSMGIRAPLANVANQVSLELANEIEQQGVTRKVAADMFGMALRSYQRKVNRLRESVSCAEKTLWQAVLDYVAEHGTSTRSQLLQAFKRDEPADVIAVPNDLVACGLLYCTGRGRGAAYGATSRSDQETLLKARTLDTLTHLVWLALAEPPGLTRSELAQQVLACIKDHALEDLLGRRVLCVDARDAAPQFERVFANTGEQSLDFLLVGVARVKVERQGRGRSSAIG